MKPLRAIPDPDAEHERLIQQTYERWMRGEAKWPELVALLNQRSPTQVNKMEREMGLTWPLTMAKEPKWP